MEIFKGRWNHTLKWDLRRHNGRSNFCSTNFRIYKDRRDRTGMGILRQDSFYKSIAEFRMAGYL